MNVSSDSFGPMYGMYVCMYVHRPSSRSLLASQDDALPLKVTDHVTVGVRPFLLVDLEGLMTLFPPPQPPTSSSSSMRPASSSAAAAAAAMRPPRVPTTSSSSSSPPMAEEKGKGGMMTVVGEERRRWTTLREMLKIDPDHARRSLIWCVCR